MDPKDVRRAWGAVGLLTLAYVLSYVDRTILLLLVGPIKSDLGISDTEFSLLHGLAFAILYTLFGIPIGLWADRGNRRFIIGIGVFVWSVMTALCGLARSFSQLFAARVGVGIGEAALSPAAYSLITDLVPRPSLGRALAVYGAAVYVGIGLSFLGGGWAVDQIVRSGDLVIPWIGVLRPWQQVLIAVGLPGLILAPILLWRLPETRTAIGRQGKADRVSIGPLIRHSHHNRLFIIAHFTGFSLISLIFNGYMAWLPEYFLRAHEWSKSTAGLWLGAIVLVFGTSGMLLSGIVTDRFARTCPRTASMRAALIGAVGLLPWPWWATTADNPWVCLLGVAPIVFFCSYCFGPAVIALQVVTPATLRAQVSALYLFVVNMAGIGLGGTAMALISDGIFEDELRIGDSMAIVGSIAALLGAYYVYVATRHAASKDPHSTEASV